MNNQISHITTVIFDMYETLVPNGRELWLKTFHEIVRDQQLEIDADVLFNGWKELETLFRSTRTNIAISNTNGSFKSYQTAWYNCFREIFATLHLHNGNPGEATNAVVRDLGSRQPFPETYEALSKLNGHLQTAVLSNADDAFLTPQIKLLNWAFDAVVSSESARAYKPLQDPFIQTMNKLNVTPAESIYVGDMLYEDIMGAKSVGMRAVWINRNGKPTDPTVESPDYTIHSLTQLPVILDLI